MNIADKKALVFFCNAYDELEELSTGQLNDYKINQISRVLRQFLFDSKSIISTTACIAMPKNGKFTFTCSPYKPLRSADLEFGSIQDGFHPEPDMPFTSPIKVSRQDLGKQLLFEYKGNPFTVKQLVKYVANKEGGVHFDQSELDVTEEVMREAQDFLGVGGRAALTSMLKSVGLVVLEGFSDLRQNAEQVLKQS
jgi:hypothetical protein